jgi:hypothetical protein
MHDEAIVSAAAESPSWTSEKLPASELAPITGSSCSHAWGCGVQMATAAAAC